MKNMLKQSRNAMRFRPIMARYNSDLSPLRDRRHEGKRGHGHAHEGERGHGHAHEGERGHGHAHEGKRGHGHAIVGKPFLFEGQHIITGRVHGNTHILHVNIKSMKNPEDYPDYLLDINHYMKFNPSCHECYHRHHYFYSGYDYMAQKGYLISGKTKRAVFFVNTNFLNTKSLGSKRKIFFQVKKAPVVIGHINKIIEMDVAVNFDLISQHPSIDKDPYTEDFQLNDVMGNWKLHKTSIENTEDHERKFNLNPQFLLIEEPDKIDVLPAISTSEITGNKFSYQIVSGVMLLENIQVELDFLLLSESKK